MKLSIALLAALLGVCAAFMLLVAVPTANKARNITAYRSAQQSRAALRRDPNDVRAHLGLSDDALRRGDRRAAIQHLRDAVRVQPGNGYAELGLANLLSRTGERAEAVTIYRRVAERDDEWSPIAEKGLRKLKARND